MVQGTALNWRSTECRLRPVLYCSAVWPTTRRQPHVISSITILASLAALLSIWLAPHRRRRAPQASGSHTRSFPSHE